MFISFRISLIHWLLFRQFALIYTLAHVTTCTDSKKCQLKTVTHTHTPFELHIYQVILVKSVHHHRTGQNLSCPSNSRMILALGYWVPAIFASIGPYWYWVILYFFRNRYFCCESQYQLLDQSAVGVVYRITILRSVVQKGLAARLGRGNVQTMQWLVCQIDGS